MRIRRSSIVLVVVVGAIAFMAVSVVVTLFTYGYMHEEVVTVTFVNETDEVLVVYFRDEYRPELGRVIRPRSGRDSVVTPLDWQDIVVIRDRVGNVLLRREITWDGLEAHDFEFVIRPEDIGGAPND